MSQRLAHNVVEVTTPLSESKLTDRIQEAPERYSRVVTASHASAVDPVRLYLKRA